MRLLGSAAVAAVAFSALPAAALDFGSGFSLVGEVELEYFKPSGGSSTYLGNTDLTLSWRSQGGNLNFGLDASVVSFHDLDTGEDTSALWYAIVLGTSYGEFAIGNPRPLHDAMFDTPDIGGSRLLSLEASGLARSFLATSVLSADGGLNSYGVNFKGGSNGLTYGGGIYRIEEGSEGAEIAEIVAQYEMNGTTVYGGYEIADLDGATFKKLMLGGQYDADRWMVGAQYSSLSIGPTDGDILKLFGSYEVLDGLSLGAQVEDISVPFDARIYGVTGTYSFGSGFAELGVGEVENGSSFGTASVGFRF